MDEWIDEPVIEDSSLDLEELTSYDLDLLTDAERAELLKDQYVPVDDVDRPNQVTAARGRFYIDSYVHPDVPRDLYIRDMHSEITRTRYKDFKELNGHSIRHSDQTGSLNFYFKDLIDALIIMKRYYGPDNLYIINGFRHPEEVGINPHGVGIAVDIHVKNWEQARRVMNAAHIAGIPTIIPSGEIEKGLGHIHLDIAPPANYIYDAGAYTGPWS